MEEKVFEIVLTDKERYRVKGTNMLETEHGGVKVVNENVHENGEDTIVFKVPEPTLMNAYLVETLQSSSSSDSKSVLGDGDEIPL